MRIFVLLLGFLAACPHLAAAQEACLTAIRPQVTLRDGDTCRIQAAVSNACGAAVRYVIVRALPHPQRGPLPTQSATAARFSLQPLSFEREMCDQSIRLLELSGDGTARDFTDRPVQPAMPLAQVEPDAQRINACVARCPAPSVDRNAILNELRGTYRHAIDEAEGTVAREAVVDAIIAERHARDRVCARVCQGSLTTAEAPTALRMLEAARASTTESAVAALSAIAARPPRRATPEPSLPAIDESERRPEGEAETAPRGRGRGAFAAAAGRSSSCRQTRRGPRCSFVLQIGPTARSAPRSEARQGRGRRSEVRQQQRRGSAQQQRRRRR